MDSQRWQKIKHLYQSALDKEEVDRAFFLEQACAGDEDLKKEVQSLLQYESGSEKFIESSALEVAAKDLAHDPAGSLVGRSIDHYRIESLLGAGGMGEVYRAQDSRLNRTVAIKVLPPHTADQPDQKLRLQREAKAIASLNHPHICVLYDIGQYGDNTEYLVMEYLEGETLADRLRKGPLAVDEALKYSIQIADALDKAHQHGIVHRDLKPGNVMLTPSGAKLLDFGLAKVHAPVRLAGMRHSPTSPSSGSSLTLHGTIVGTLQYMAPEQLEGQDADARTDIFAFGGMLYEMVTGEKAFQGKSQVSVMAAIMDHTPAPASSIRAVVSPLLDHLIRVCLEKDASHRWQSASDVLIQLRFLADGGSGLQRSDPAGKKTNLREIVAWSIAALLVATLGIALLNRPVPTRPLGAQMRFELNTPSSSNPGHIAFSPDGTRIVAVVDAAPSSKLWLRNSDELGGKLLEYTDGAQNPFWSPDGRFIAFFAGDKLKKIGLFGAPAEIICDAPPSWGGTWNSGDVILFGSESGIWQVTPDKKTALITKVNPELAESGHFRPEFLPDGKHFLYLSQNANPDNSAIYLGSLDSTPPKRILAAKLKTVFAPPNHLLFVRDVTLMAQEFDLARMEAVGDPWPLGQGVGSNGTNGQASFSVSNDGHLAFRLGGETENHLLLKMDRSGHITGQVGIPAPYQNPVLSSDGEFVAVRRQSDIVIINAASDNIQPPLTQDPAVEDHPVWSADRTHIAFSSTRAGGVANLYVKRSDNAGPEELIQKSANPQLPQSWSTTGYLLYEEKDPKTKSDLWTVSMKDRKVRVFLRTPADETQAQFSPDGQFVAYVSNASGAKEVYVRRFAMGESRRVSTKGGTQPRWGENGELFFLSGTPEEFMVVNIPLKSSDPLTGISEPRLLFKYDVATLNQRNSYDVMKGHGFLLNGIPRPLGEVAPIVVVLNWMHGKPRN
jgi:serine/threonine protein kinase/Tol biopolymer transport system component